MNAAPMPSLNEPPVRRPDAAGPSRRAYLTEAKYEAMRMLRSPGFSIPFLVLPVPIYLFFGVMLAAPAIAKQAGARQLPVLAASRCSPSWARRCSVSAACWRSSAKPGYLKLKRALPAPGGAYLIAKMVMAMVFAALAMSTLLVAALLVGKITLSAAQLAVMTLVMMVGALPFAAIGLFIGAYVLGQRRPGDRQRHLPADAVAVGPVHPAAEVPRAVGGDLAGVPPEPGGARRRRRLGVQLHVAGNLGGRAARIHRGLRRPGHPPSRAKGVR